MSMYYWLVIRKIAEKIRKKKTTNADLTADPKRGEKVEFSGSYFNRIEIPG